MGKFVTGYNSFYRILKCKAYIFNLFVVSCQVLFLYMLDNKVHLTEKFVQIHIFLCNFFFLRYLLFNEILRMWITSWMILLVYSGESMCLHMLVLLFIFNY